MFFNECNGGRLRQGYLFFQNVINRTFFITLDRVFAGRIVVIRLRFGDARCKVVAARVGAAATTLNRLWRFVLVWRIILVGWIGHENRSSAALVRKATFENRDTKR